MKTLSLSCYPHPRTRQDLATACRGAKSIFLCGQASNSAKLSIAKALAQEVSDQKILYISCCESSKKTLKKNPADTVTSLTGYQQNLSAVCLYDNFAEKICELMETLGSNYVHFVLAISSSDSTKTETYFPATADTVLLLPGTLGKYQLHSLINQIYDHDYTIAGVVEAETIATLQTNEMTSGSFMLCNAEVK